MYGNVCIHFNYRCDYCFFSRDCDSQSLYEEFPQHLHDYILTIGRNRLPTQYIITDDYKSVSEALQSEKRIILKGPKGCGKSLLLLKLLSNLIQKDEQILYLSARTLERINVELSREYFNP